MPLPIPNLDDRNFDDLVNAAIQQIKDDLNTDWSDLSPGDPGLVLLETFSYLTEQMIYRLNRLPRKVFITFLRMIGVTMVPPTAARVQLAFWQNPGAKEAITLPWGSLVSTAESSENGERPLFMTAEDLVIPAKSDSEATAASVLAFHAEHFEELLGKSNGVAGQSFQLRWPPVIAPTGSRRVDLAVGVEVSPDEKTPADWLGADGLYYRLWSEVDSFYGLKDSDPVFTVDRQAGLIRFAPAALMSGEPLEAAGTARSAGGGVRQLAAKPLAGRAIRAWYAHGGGEAGNVTTGKLTALVSLPGGAPLPQVNVTNPAPARGGFDAETLDNALVRGPQEIYAQRRAVTAREFEQVATRSRYVARARAITRADLWQHAAPGTVDLVLVPRLTSTQPVVRSSLRHNEQAESLDLLKRELKERSPLGIRTQLRWARYKKVWVEADITYGSNEEQSSFETRIENHLRQLVAPLTVTSGAEAGADKAGQAAVLLQAGRPFGQQLSVADIYNAILAAEKSKILITSLDLVVEYTPCREIRSLAADYFQPQTWYVGSFTQVFRTTNDGAGWELVLHFARGAEIPVFRAQEVDGAPRWVAEKFTRREVARHVCPNPARAGLLAVTSQYISNGKTQSPLYISLDCGESWYDLGTFQDGEIEGLAWLTRADRQVLLLATSRGLFEANLKFKSSGEPESAEFFPIPVLLDQPDHPLYAITVLRGANGNLRVAVALRSRRGVYLSASDDLSPMRPPGSDVLASRFSLLGLQNEDIRHLNVQQLDERIYLWAGAMALANVGEGCYRWQFDQNSRQQDEGRWIGQEWNGGSCLALAFDGPRVFAVSAWGGMLRTELDPNRPDLIPRWIAFPHEELPRRRTELEETQGRRGLFEAIYAVATNGQAAGRAAPVVMLGGSDGVYRSQDRGVRFDKTSRNVFRNLKDTVTIPPDWLLVSGPHAIDAHYDADLGRQPTEFKEA